MKKLYLTFALLLSVFVAVAQRSFEVGLASGICNYYGDLGNESILQTGSTRPGVAVTLRNFTGNSNLTGNLYNPFSMETRFSWHRIGYDETNPIRDQQGWELRNYGRGINFQNDIYGFSTHITYTLYSNKRIPLHRQGAAIFVFTGVGVYYGKPKADLFRGNPDNKLQYYYWNDGTTRDMPEEMGYGNIISKDGDYETDLTEWCTENGQGFGEAQGRKKYKNFHVGIPMGFGFRYGLSKVLTASVEFGYYYFLTDFLDDVHDQYVSYDDLEERYPNDKEMQNLALYISDPTGWGTNGYPFSPPTSPRGNPESNDAYSFINLELAYKFNLRGEKVRFFGRR